MRHLKAGRRLNRNAAHRLALFRNLTLALIRHERIITTVAKAKEVRPFAEKLITLATYAHLYNQEAESASDDKEKARLRAKALHARRQVLARLGPPSKSEVRPVDAEASKDSPPDGDDRQVIIKLFNEIAPRYLERPGGYLRILKRSQRRLGDAGETAFLEFVKPGDRPVKTKATPPAPAPVVAPKPAEPAPAEAKTETPTAEAPSSTATPPST